MDTTSLGDRIKEYEASTDQKIMSRLPVVVRLDGRSFSKFCKGMKKPFDEDMSQAMINTAKYLVRETQAKIAYTQSDEITLILHDENMKKHNLMFNGRVQKVCSIFSSLASTYFLTEVMRRWPEKIKNGRFPTFDCRAFAVPSKSEAYNALLWREHDATKNSVSMFAQAYFKHAELHKKSTKEKKQMLLDIGVNWDEAPTSHKRGTYVQKKRVNVVLDPSAICAIPKEHRPKNGMVLRSEIAEVDMPILTRVKNIQEVIFEAETPATK